jgi:hypothetical protein
MVSEQNNKSHKSTKYRGEGRRRRRPKYSVYCSHCVYFFKIFVFIGYTAKFYTDAATLQNISEERKM